MNRARKISRAGPPVTAATQGEPLVSQATRGAPATAEPEIQEPGGVDSGVRETHRRKRAHYEATSLEPLPNEELFLRVRTAALGAQAASPAVFRWQYGEAPGGPSQALLLRASRGRSAEPVGWVSLEARRLLIDGREHRAGLLVNLVVAPEHRTVRPALLLQRGATARARESFDLAYGYPNHAALGGFLRAGHRKLGPIVRYACVLGGHGAKLTQAGVRPELAKLAGLGADIVSPAARRVLWWRWRRRHAFEWPSYVDARFERLWQRAQSGGGGRVLADRSAGFIAWRLRSHPHERYGLAALLERRSGEISGYAAVQRRGKRAHIGDLFAESDDAYGPLLDGLLASLAREDVEVVDFCYLGNPAVVAALQRRGFRSRGEIRTAIVDANQLAAPWLLDPERWHLTAVDGDL